MVFKRSQQAVSENSKHWYQDKYQHVLTQRNILALVSIIALITAAVAVFAVMRLAPLKSVEPYLVQIDDKTGVTQRVTPITRNEYAANEAVDRYFVSLYVRSRESHNFSVLRYTQNLVRVTSTTTVFNEFRRQSIASNEDSLSAKLGADGQREVRIKSIAYITNPPVRGSTTVTPSKIMQVRLSTADYRAGGGGDEQHWVATLNFEYASLKLNEEEQLLNPLGFTVTSYQIQREIN